MSSSLFTPNKKGHITFEIGKDFTKDDYDKWLAQIALWISKTQTNEPSPTDKAEHIMACAVSGSKLSGEPWVGVENFTLTSRIMQFCGFNIETGKGRTRKIGLTSKKNRLDRKKHSLHVNSDAIIEATIEEMVEAREEYKQLLFQEHPFLDNEVYAFQVNALSDAVVKLDQISNRFLASKAKETEDLLKIRDGLKKDIDDFMKILRIHPSQIKAKTDEFERGDIGALINKWEEYGEIADIYERVDAIQELIQTVRQLEQIRLDGSPQLADYLLWHKTGAKRTRFTCEHGTEYELFDGFTKEELYSAAEQAYEVFGMGIKRIEESTEESDTPFTELVDTVITE